MSTAATFGRPCTPGEIERYTFRERVMHWLTGLTYLYCLATGLAFYSPHLYWLACVLGGGAHVALLASDHRHRIPHGHAVDEQPVAPRHGNHRDRQALAGSRRGLHHQSTRNILPLSERFNGGQKLFYWLMVYGALLLLLSGVFLWFPEYIPRQAGLGARRNDPAARDRRARDHRRIHHPRLHGRVPGAGQHDGDHYRMGLARLGQDASSPVVHSRHWAAPPRNEGASTRASTERDQLTRRSSRAAPLLTFYRELARFQKPIF